MKKQLISISVGADTEVELVKNHRIARARTTLEERYGWDSWDYPDLFFFEEGRIGVDGSDNQIELRPEPSQDPLILLDNHYTLLKKLGEEGIIYNLNTKTFPCGMHIHFGPSKLKLDTRWIQPLIDIGRILNEDPPTQQRVRLEHDYGKEDDYRDQHWGVEYRGFPSVILAIPEIAEEFFVGIYNLVRKSVNGYISKADGFKEIIEELKQKVEKPYMFANVPQVDCSVMGFKGLYFSRWLERKMGEELKPPYPIVSFYSLRKDRGMVTAGLKTSLTKQIEHPSEKTARKIFRFGIPYEWKINGIPEKVWGEIFDAIKKLAKEEEAVALV